MKRTGIVLMILGVCLLASAVVLYVNNINENEQAEELTEYYLPKLVESIKTNTSTSPDDISCDTSNVENEDQSNDMITIIPDFYDTEMKVTVVDGYGFVGYLSIPDLELELPILSETDNERLKIAPCLFHGSTKTDDLVIGAHNYSKHFGKIGELEQGASIFFTDMNGSTYEYSVISIEILQPRDADILTNGEFDLTLYTCTYGGRTRLIVRCDRRE